MTESTEPEPADANPAAVHEPESAESAEATMRRRFQEALARKHSGGGAGGQAPGGQGRGVGPSAGGKVQRQFRRKSG